MEDDNVGLESISPYVTYSTRIGSNTKIHLGASYSYFTSEFELDEVEASSYASGTTVSVGLEQAISKKTLFVADAEYDVSFEGFRIGGAALFRWDVFRLKLGLDTFLRRRICLAEYRLMVRFNG